MSIKINFLNRGACTQLFISKPLYELKTKGKYFNK